MSDTRTVSSRSLPFETASWARRMGALIVDWLACALIASIFVGWGNSRAGWVADLVFVIETAAFTCSLGGSFGQLATRLRVVRTNGAGTTFDPRPLDPVRALARQILVAVVIPPLIFRPDGRGLHDMAAGTATVTLDTYRALR